MSLRPPREWLKYSYLDPKKILIGLRNIEQDYPLSELRYEAASLRTRELRPFGEGRQAALFCYGMGIALGVEVYFAQVERQDYDIVAHFVADNESHFVPIQLKEWVPDFLPNAGTLQDEVAKLSKYADSTDLVVAFHLNRTTRLELDHLVVPTTVAELWFFGAMDPKQKRWHLIGNLLSPQYRAYEFEYPTA